MYTWRKLCWSACLAMLWAAAGPAGALVDERIRIEGDVELEATFNQPGLNDEPSTRLEDRVIQMISLAVPGSEIFVSIYTFTSVAVAESLLDAQDRGVTVRVLVDNKSLRRGNAAMELLRWGSAERDRLRGCPGRCVKICWIGCHGFHINHNKFVLFSELRDGSRWVVAQSSANFTTGQHSHYNDLIVIKNDRQLYRVFTEYFSDLGRRVWSPRYYRRERGASGINVYFFPRLFGPDPIAKMLDDVECDSDSVIRVAHSRFDSWRMKVARRLRALSDRGCDVHVILREEPGKFSPGSAVTKELDGLVTVLPYKGGPGGEARNAIHTKLLLIKSRYAGSDKPRHMVLTGSHNLSLTSLRLNDEVLLRVDNEALFDAYARFWGSILEAHDAR